MTFFFFGDKKAMKVALTHSNILMSNNSIALKNPELEDFTNFFRGDRTHRWIFI